MSKDNCFLDTLSGKVRSTPPIWFMRQAGRHLPEYRQLRAKAGSFTDLCYNPEFAAEVTMQPVRRYDLDAAILFADILLVPDAMGLDLSFLSGEGPKLSPVVTAENIGDLRTDTIIDYLAPVFETVARVKSQLDPGKALIGFAGAPWTVATYMLAGKGTKDPSAQRSFWYDQPDAFDLLIDKLVTVTTDYLIAQIEAGADAVQLFDSWAAGLPEDLFKRACFAPTAMIARRVKEKYPAVPIIAFPKGAGPHYQSYAKEESFDALSIDTGLPWHWVREHLSPTKVIQGGLDPLLVVKGGDVMAKAALDLRDCFADMPYIFNLGHGFVPETPPEYVAQLVKIIRGI